MLVVIIHPEQWNGGSEIHEVGLRLHPGDWFSQNIALGFHLALSDIRPDLIVVDHSASCVPMLKWRFPTCKVLFYCHFPQQLVTPSRFFLYRWYSNAVGLIEAKLYRHADVVMVNSKFTGTIKRKQKTETNFIAENFKQVMPSVPSNKVQVVYPPCDVDSLSVGMNVAISRKNRPANDRYTFLSMNRFWPEKRLDIIVEAAGCNTNTLPLTKEFILAILKSEGKNPRIQLAGSVMPHIPESRIYYEELQRMCVDYKVEDLIEFVVSPTEAKKFTLFRECDTTLYTPPNEHFGIVPIEALEQRRPVIVIDSGGPAETVIENVTGTKIAEPCGKLLAHAMLEHMQRQSWEHLDDDEKYVEQRKRFVREFSAEGFGNRIDDAIRRMFPDTQLPIRLPTIVENETVETIDESTYKKASNVRNNLRQRA
ncbi:Glycosyl transferase domain containing protein [Aphelenchoides besseyi]|nr:Glycosyl transferase domain containing protein [Aphelenchoides besseyi]